jgi:hypothetical protein
MNMMSLLGTTIEQPRSSKKVRYTVTGIALVILAAIAVWFFFLRFAAEKRTVTRFLDAVIAGQFEQAYQIWHPEPTYSYNDFLQDWGPTGYYGPVRSFRITKAEQPKDGSGVTIEVEVSPFQPFPDDRDAVKSRQTKDVRLWVERRDQSISFAP